VENNVVLEETRMCMSSSSSVLEGATAADWHSSKTWKEEEEAEKVETWSEGGFGEKEKEGGEGKSGILKKNMGILKKKYGSVFKRADSE